MKWVTTFVVAPLLLTKAWNYRPFALILFYAVQLEGGQRERSELVSRSCKRKVNLKKDYKQDLHGSEDAVISA